jgi:predicted ATPase
MIDLELNKLIRKIQRMLHSFHIKNYRGFKDFKIEPLERINLITGSNNVGKTSLLEALYLDLAPGFAIASNLSSDNREKSNWLNLFRGLSKIGFKIDNESKFGWLFYGKDLSRTIELISVDEKNGGSRSLTMSWRTISGDPLSSVDNSVLQASSDIPLNLLIWFKNFDGEEYEWKIKKNGWDSPPGELFGIYPIRVLINDYSRSPEEDAKWFSKLDDVGRQDELLSALRIIDPRLKKLAVSVADGVPMVYGDIGIGRRIPMSQMGEGMVRLLSLVLEITNASGGVVLIDEVENGLHYSVMNSVWKALAAAAHQSDTQIFATTHSFECIRAAHEAFISREEYDFRLHRLDRVESDIRSVTYDADMLSAAIVSDFEVR